MHVKNYLTKAKNLIPKKIRGADKRVLAVSAFVVIGLGTLVLTKAATPTAFFEAESATLSCAPSGSDASASGGQYIQFSGSDCAGQTQTASSITQWGITWNFSQPKPVGQFANGDWWVVGPVSITSITPNFDGTQNGWQVNPAVANQQSFDRNADYWNASLMPAFPYNAQPGSSIVKVISIPQPSNCGVTFNGACFKTAAVLTVLGSVPANNGATVFRPPYVGTNKPQFSTNDLDANIPALPRLTSTASIDSHLPTLSQSYENVRRMNIVHIQEIPAYYPIDNINMPSGGYAPGISNRQVDAVLRSLIAKPGDSETERRNVLIASVQRGIDNYGARALGMEWYAAGGHNNGFRFPTVFAARMLNNQTIKDVINNSGRQFFAETDMIIPVGSARANVVLFGQNRSWAANLEDEYWGKVAAADTSWSNKDPYGYIDGGSIPGDSYQACCTTSAMKAMSLAIHLVPGMVQVWNDNAMLDYVERWVTVGAWTQPDPCAPLSQGGGKNTSRPGECKLDPDLTAGSTFTNFSCQSGKQCGRFPAEHGSFKDFKAWESDLAEAMWPVFRSRW